MKSTVHWWGQWPVWVAYVASLWSLAYALLGVYWTLGGPSFPFGENDPTQISILSELSVEIGGPAIAALGLLAALAGFVMARARGSGIAPILLIGFGWSLSVTLLLIIPDYRVLMAVAYGIVFLVGAPFNWPPANYFEIFTWPVVNQIFILFGGFLWGAATLAYGRRTGLACGNCGRVTEVPFWKTPSGAARWGKWATYIAFFIPLIYAMTRWAWALGIPLGITEELLRDGLASGMWLAGAALATLSVAGAFLTLGLIQPWGATFPKWIPYFRGRAVPLPLAVIPATLVSVLIISAGLMFIRLALTGVFTVFFGSGNPATYVPELFWPLWGLALAAATLAYYYRRRGRCLHCGRL
jgi:hypothetical protein